MDLILKKYSDFLNRNKMNYFSFIAMSILVGSIWGGVAAMFIHSNDAPVWQLALNVALSMANLVMAIGQAPLKWVVNVFITAFVMNGLLILINL